MNRRYLNLGLGLFAITLSAACSSDKGSGTKGPDGGSGAGTSTGGVAAGSGGGSSSGGAAAGSGGTASGSGGAGVTGCDLSPCKNMTAFGQQLTACCQTASLCGVSSSFINRCFDPSLIPSADASILQSEPIVSDPKCKAAQLPSPDGGTSTFAGCCDKSNVCGYSTADLPSVGGFKFPTQCLTPDKINQLGSQAGQARVDAGASVPCVYPTK